MGLDILILVLMVVLIAMIGEANRRLALLERRLLNDETQNEQRRMAEDGRRFRTRDEGREMRDEG